MKKIELNISKQNIYLFSLAVTLFIFIIIFSFAIFIPEGKEYRVDRTKINLLQREHNIQYKYNSKILSELKELQGKNNHIIKAFKRKFSPDDFQNSNKKYFKALHVTKGTLHVDKDSEFDTFNVQAVSKIDSPISFYKFIDALSKESWIIKIELPITFKREKELIETSFNIRVYKDKTVK